MTLDELKDELRNIKDKFGADPEIAHPMADNALMLYIGDSEVIDLFHAVPRWYS